MNPDILSRQPIIEVVDLVAFIPADEPGRDLRARSPRHRQASPMNGASLVEFMGNILQRLCWPAGLVGLVAARLIGRLGGRARGDGGGRRLDYGRDTRMAAPQNGS